jgi:tRNA dimethylallyltransferase
MSHPTTMIIIFGPTAVGKSDFAERLARKVPAEIINMDVGQLYAPLSIGTAKPDWQNSPIVHHLFDELHEPINYTVTQYRDRVLSIAQEIWQKGKVPILVGGSGFYLRSLLFPPGGAVSNGSLIDRDKDQHAEEVWHQLNAIDPARAAALGKNDLYRINRALDIWHSTGTKPSEVQALYTPPSHYYLFFLTRERTELYERINDRVIAMMRDGWLDEVARLRGTAWEEYLYTKKLIGYNELLAMLSGDYTPECLEKTIRGIQQRTRHYAKRQHTFWRMLFRQLQTQIAQEQNTDKKPVLETLNLTFLDLDLYINELSKQVLEALDERKKEAERELVKK